MANLRLIERARKLVNSIETKNKVSLERYDILVNGVSILPAPLRFYQRRVFDLFIHNEPVDNIVYNKFFLMWCRRSGKSFTAFIMLVYICLRDANTNAFQLFPSYKSAYRIIWNGVFINGGENQRYIKMLPSSIATVNNTRMEINFYNGSSISLVGIDDEDKVRGITSNLIAISEYCYCKDYLLSVLSPIISSSNGKLLLESTPNGRNFAWLDWCNFKNTDVWYRYHGAVDKLVDENGKRYITDRVVKEAINDGLSESLISQEFYCLPVLDENLIVYARELKEMQINKSTFDPRLQVHFAFDLGVNDNTAIVCFQLRLDGGCNVVYCYENNNKPYEHYINHLLNKFSNARIGAFVLPHDSAKRNAMSLGLETVAQHFESFNINVERLPRPKSMAGFISLVKSYMASVVVDESCKGLINALNNYSYDEKTRKPIHDKNSHYASAFGYMCMSLYYGNISNNQLNEVKHYSA